MIGRNSDCHATDSGSNFRCFGAKKSDSPPRICPLVRLLCGAVLAISTGQMSEFVGKKRQSFVAESVNRQNCEWNSH